MYKSLDAERVAVQKKIDEFHYNLVDQALSNWEQTWDAEIVKARSLLRSESLAESFHNIITMTEFDSIIVMSDDQLDSYPNPYNTALPMRWVSPLYLKAQDLEFHNKDPQSALDLYSRLYKESESSLQRSYVALAQARCQVKLSMFREAINTLKSIRLSHSMDVNDIAMGAWVRALELMIDLGIADQASFTPVIYKSLVDYSTVPLSSRKRLFLLKRLLALRPHEYEDPNFSTLKAENLAEQFLSQSSVGVFEIKVNQMRLLVLEEHLSRSIERAINLNLDGLTVNVILRQLSVSEYRRQSFQNRVYTRLLDGHFSGLLLDVEWGEEISYGDPFVIQFSKYILTGVCIIFLLLLSSWYIFIYFRKQDRLNKLKNDVVATVSHELKTPLTSIRLLVDNLLSDESIKGQQREVVQIIQTENVRLTRLAENFLTFSKIENDRLRLVLEEVSVLSVINESIISVSDRFLKNAVELTVDTSVLDSSAKPCFVLADKEMLKTCLINLLDNACKYSSVGAKISIVLQLVSQNVHIMVTDNGVGLSDKDKGKVFERYYRSDQCLNRSTEGCGLGLNIAMYIMRKHRGSINVESKLGSGSRFTAYLPILGGSDVSE